MMRLWWRGPVALVLTLGAIGAVAPAAALTSIAAAQAGLATKTLIIDTGTKSYRYTVEMAETPDQQEIGLMYRRKMAQNHGMIFPFATPRVLTFWMENTYLPLDLIFIGSDGRVVHIAPDAKPMSRDVISSEVPASAVLELNAGEAARIGLKPGDRVSYQAAK